MSAKNYYPFITFVLILQFVLAGWGCTSKQKEHSERSRTAGHSQFEHQVHAEFAEGFSITYKEDYKLLEVQRPFQNYVDTLRYALIPRKMKDQIQVDNAVEIPIPVKSIVATSTTHVGFLEMLDAIDILTGMSGAEYIYSEKVRNRVKGDDIANLPNGELNKEKILSMNPDLVMISGGQASQYDNYQLLMETGVNIFVNSEWLETTPLGKAEWVKVLAALLNKEQLANERFNKIKRDYQELRKKVNEPDQKPLVINNMPYKGAWFVSGGNSFTAQYLRDAGANYPWFDTDESGGLRRDFEVVYEVGLKADIWINPGTTRTKDDILAKDSRFSEFRSFKTGQIYNNNKRIHANGGNDFWESGVVHPERILADLIKIFHPQILPDHEFYYYRRVD